MKNTAKDVTFFSDVAVPCDVPLAELSRLPSTVLIYALHFYKERKSEIDHIRPIIDALIPAGDR